MVEPGHTTVMAVGKPDGEDGEDDEMPVEKAGLAKAFLSWIRLQVSHWAALDILSSIRDAPDDTVGVEVSLPALPHPKIVKYVNWEEMVTALFPQPILDDDQDGQDNQHIPVADARYIIELIKAEGNTIFHAFDPEIGTLKFSGTYHCEAVLASLITLINSLSYSMGNGELKKLIEVWS
jgi:hypothetical protein